MKNMRSKTYQFCFMSHSELNPEAGLEISHSNITYSLLKLPHSAISCGFINDNNYPMSIMIYSLSTLQVKFQLIE